MHHGLQLALATARCVEHKCASSMALPGVVSATL
jgi:hypothetical protein